MHGLTAQKGEAKTELPVAYDGDPLTISMDHRYVADFLKTLDNESAFTISAEMKVPCSLRQRRIQLYRHATGGIGNQ